MLITPAPRKELKRLEEWRDAVGTGKVAAQERERQKTKSLLGDLVKASHNGSPLLTNRQSCYLRPALMKRHLNKFLELLGSTDDRLWAMDERRNA
jgi:hypothetical protein